MTHTNISLTAIHEASHCCLYRAFGVVVNGVRINPDGTGRVHRYNIDSPESLPLMINAQDGAISVAGVVGEAIHEYGEVKINAILTKLMFGGGQGDYDRIQECGVDHLIEELMTFSYSVLIEHWSKVLRLAARLDQVQYLDSDEISSELPYVYDFSRYSAQLHKEIGGYGARWTWNRFIKRGLCSGLDKRTGKAYRVFLATPRLQRKPYKRPRKCWEWVSLVLMRPLCSSKKKRM
ncbi:hypothetical protein N836_10580 [Leptolyngbya sp. Heron Island J]|uniref:hypothetical protein n=1 Tax=Leptolyngbya sp. Heron Island J TaxID=1385935 RepID=UPI0003B97C10|nr:hypothetical protein [Leptolyngbya sp. Heron Island J]ESA35703.1 hypothetical protein N836_10580 [Leptolyngbya sp. Heron Island J]